MTNRRRSRPVAILGLIAALLCACHQREPAGRADTVLPRSEPVLLSVRVLDERGPLGDVEVEVTTDLTQKGNRATNSTSHTHALRTDEHGFLRLPIARPEGVKNPLELVKAWQFAPWDSEEVRVEVRSSNLYGERTLVGPFAPGETRAEIELAPMSVLAAGRVVDADGRAVPHAEVFCASPVLSHPTGRTTTAEDGTFVLHVTGSKRPESLHLLATHADQLSDSTTISAGTHDVTLVLTSAMGTLAGSVLLDPGVPRERIGLTYVAAGPLAIQSAHGLGSLQLVLDEKGAFELRMLPGKHELRITVDDEEVLRLSDLVIVPGTVRDPRCDPLDLRGRIRMLRLTLIAPASTHELEGHVWARKLGHSILHFEGREVLLLTLGDALGAALDVELRVVGFRPVHLQDVRGDQTVVLQPGWPIRLVLADDVPLPEPPVSWSAVLCEEERWCEDARIRFGTGQRVALAIATQLGEIELEWIRSERVGDDLYESAWGGEREGPAQSIFVSDVPGVQEFRVGWVPAPR